MDQAFLAGPSTPTSDLLFAASEGILCCGRHSDPEGCWRRTRKSRNPVWEVRWQCSEPAQWGVYIVHILVFGSGRTGAGSARTPHVSAGAQCLRGSECGSSPTSGTVLPQVRGFFAVWC
jgi:hypothetical protein